MGYSPWGRKELDTTGWLNKHSTESLEWPSGELSSWISLPGKGVTSLMNVLSSCGQSELYNSSSFPLCCWLLGRQIQMCGLKVLGLFWTENLSQTGLHQTGFVGSCKEKAVGGPVGPSGLSHSKYLSWVFLRSYRLNPPAPSPRERESPSPNSTDHTCPVVHGVSSHHLFPL